MRRRSSPYDVSFSQRDVPIPSLAKLRANFLNLAELQRRLVLLSEDRRQYDPVGDYRWPRGLSRLASTVKLKRSNVYNGASNRLQRDVFRFAVPEKVAICVRRKMRREVLFAERQIHSGAGARRARNYYTDVSCERRR